MSFTEGLPVDPSTHSDLPIEEDAHPRHFAATTETTHEESATLGQPERSIIYSSANLIENSAEVSDALATTDGDVNPIEKLVALTKTEWTQPPIGNWNTWIGEK